MAIRINIDGLGGLEFPDGTSESVIQSTVDRLVKRETAARERTQPAIQPEIPSPTAQEPAEVRGPAAGSRRLLETLSGVGEQFQKGVAVQEKELGQLLGAPKQVERLTEVPEPTGFPQKAARFAGEVLAPSPALLNVPGLAFTINQTAGLLSTGAKKLATPIAKAAKKGVGFTGEVLSGVPREFFERAIEKEVLGQSVFKGAKESFEELGKKAQKAMNFVSREAGKAVGEENIALKGKGIKIKVDDFVRSIDDKIQAKSFEGFSELEEKDIKLLNKFKTELLKGTKREVKDKAGEIIGEQVVMDAAALKIIKKNMQNLAKFDLETVGKVGSEGKGILKAVSGEINDVLNRAVPDLAEANAKFSRLSDLKARLKTDLKDKSVARNIKNLTNKDEFTRELFKELDEVAPDDLKFFDKLQDTVVRDAFDQLFPGRGGGSGSAQGFANILRLGSIGAGGITPGLAPLISPKAQGLGIRGTGALLRGVGGGAAAVGPEVGAGIAGRIGLQQRRLFSEN